MKRPSKKVSCRECGKYVLLGRVNRENAAEHPSGLPVCDSCSGYTPGEVGDYRNSRRRERAS